MQVQPLTAETIPVAAELATRIWPRAYGDLLSPEQITYQLADRTSESTLRGYLDHRDRGYDLAFAAGLPVGYCSYRRESVDELRLEQIYVDPDLHGTGIGDALMAHVSRIAADWSLARISLTVNRGNTRAIAFYRRHCFVVVADVVKDIGGGFVMDDHVMECRIEPPTDAVVAP